MYLIADCGSTKTHWSLLTNSGQRSDFKTDGMNPTFMSVDDMCRCMSDQLMPQLAQHLWIGPIHDVWFYGAGCTAAQQPRVAEAICRVFRQADAHVCSDMLGAARAVLGRERGIACILGTGSNSCLYDGHDISNGVPAGGFILGDEGSGAVMGRMLISNILKRQLPDALCDTFYAETGLDYAAIVDHVYRQPMPNRFLASFAPFVKKQMTQWPELASLVEENMCAFLTRNIAHYAGAHTLPIGCIGSIAFHFEQQLRHAAQRLGFHIGTVMADPMDGLVRYHRQEPLPA